jgi:hypothetical protein
MRALAFVALLAASCQTRTQATVVALGTGGIAVVGGYAEHESGAPPLTAISAGTVAVISAISLLFLDRRPWMPFDSPLGWDPAPRHGDSVLLAAIQRTGCFGPCPAYGVALYRDGYVDYVGQSNVRTLGEATDRLGHARVSALEQTLEQAGIFDLDNGYVHASVADAPTVYVFYRSADGRTKWIEHYLDDRSAPAQLVAIEHAIDDATGTEHWIDGGSKLAP